MENSDTLPASTRLLSLAGELAQRSGDWTLRRQLIVLFAVNLAITIPLVIGYELQNDEDREARLDLYVFRDRADTIVNGDLLYRDTFYPTLTPPVINYLLVPPVLLGDTIPIWECYFSLFNFIGASLVLLLLHPVDQRLGMTGALLYITNPLSYSTSVSMVQDDTIVPCFILLALLFLFRGRKELSAFSIGLGSMVKMFPIVGAMVVLLSSKGFAKQLRVLLVIFGTAAIISAPFLFLALSDFSIFLKFYFLGIPPPGTPVWEGMSSWRLLASSGLSIPHFVNIIFLLFAYMCIWTSLVRGKLAPANAFSLSFVVFFFLYWKLAMGYYLIFVILVIPFVMCHPSHAWHLLLFSILTRGTHLARYNHYFAERPTILLALSLPISLYCIWWAGLLSSKDDFSVVSKGADSETRIQSISRTTMLASLAGLLLALLKGAHLIISNL